MVELHSNYTVTGQRRYLDGVYPTNHQEHETLELTQGINDWAEVGFYVFTSEQDGHGVQWVGDHIRPRGAPRTAGICRWGLSLSTEVGYQRAVYSPDTWTWEIRPIVDKTVGRWYLAFNPALERTWHGPDVNQGLGFSPGFKVSYDFTRQISGGFEYYADYGRLGAFDDLRQQQQQIFAVTDLNVSPKWEINFGVGIGPTAATDHLIVKGSWAGDSTGGGGRRWIEAERFYECDPRRVRGTIGTLKTQVLRLRLAEKMAKLRSG